VSHRQNDGEHGGADGPREKNGAASWRPEDDLAAPRRFSRTRFFIHHTPQWVKTPKTVWFRPNSTPYLGGDMMPLLLLSCRTKLTANSFDPLTE
jgi:hypothetical protein